MFIMTIIFECDCGVQFGVAPNQKTGAVGPMVGVKTCDQHRPSEIALDPKPWDPTGFTVKSFSLDKLEVAAPAIVKPDTAAIVGDFERKIKP
jgi:hypothetical protein